MSYAKSLWIKPADIRKHGLLIVCEQSDASCAEKAAGFMMANAQREKLTITRKIGARQMPEFTFDVFIIPPQPG